MRYLLATLAVGLSACERPPGPAGPAAAGAPAAATVAVTRVASERVAKVFRVPGELHAFRNVALHSKVSGFVEWIGVDRGSPVKAGQALVRLAAPEIAAQKQEAEAKLAADEATLRRWTEASKTPGVVAGHDLDLASKNVQAARARARVCEEQESYLRISAPFDGVITERTVHEGSLIGAAAPMLRLQEVARLRLTVAVPEVAAGEIPAGKKVSFAVAAFPGETFGGTVARPARALDVKTRSMPVEVDVDNSSGRLAPGMFAEVRWPMERAKPSLLVPASAVAVTTERSFVVRVREGVADWVDVRTGLTVGDRVEIFCEVAEGDLVAVRGTDEIRPGTKVVPKEAR